MTVTWSPDMSNWDSPAVEQNAACIVSSSSGPPVVRASLENTALSAITVAQLQAFVAAGATPLTYSWCYGQDVPEQVVTNTIKLIDPYVTIKRLAPDIEDTTYFLKQSKQPIPKRIMVQQVVGKAGSLGTLAPADAVIWLRRFVTEARTQGYQPMFYSVIGLWNQLCGGDTSFSDVDGWCADWDSNPDPTVVVPFGGITNWCGKQYLSSGSDVTICGLSLDLNVWIQEKINPIPAPPIAPTGPDVVDAQARLNMLDQAIDTNAANLHALVQGAREDLNA